MEVFGPLLLFGSVIAIVIAVAAYFEKKRTAELAEIAHDLSMDFSPKDEGKAFRNYLAGFHLTSLGRGRKVHNIFSGKAAEWDVTVFDYQYTVGGGKNSSTYKQTVTLFESSQLAMPNFKMKPENIFHRIGNTFGMQDIDFDAYPEFSKQYLLQGEDEDAIRNFFNHKILTIFTEKKGLCVEANHQRLIVYRSGKRAKPYEIAAYLQEYLEIANYCIQH